jgi:cobalt-zinc-cadmium efflux system protein
MAHAHHGHSHGHDPKHTHAQGRAQDGRRLAIALGITLTFFIVEVGGGLLSHSLALLQDAGHMLLDVVAQGLALLALYVASRPADARRTYGWHRVEILAALLNGVTLVALSGSVMWWSVMRLRSPVAVQFDIMLYVAAIGLVANLIGAWLLHGSENLNMRSAYLHVLLDSVSSLAVLIGAAVMKLTGRFTIIDPILSLILGVLVLYSSYAVIRDAVNVLLETVPADIDLAGVTHALDHIEGVTSVHDLHIWTITSGLICLSAHIVAGGDADPAVILARAQKVLLDDFCIGHTTIQIEAVGHEHLGQVC